MVLYLQKLEDRRIYFLEQQLEWFDDLEQKSRTDKSCENNKPPQGERRAWMAVRHALIKRYSPRGMIDFQNYDQQFYPDIKSVAEVLLQYGMTLNRMTIALTLNIKNIYFEL